MKLAEVVLLITGAVSIVLIFLGGFIYELETQMTTLQRDINSTIVKNVTSFTMTSTGNSSSFSILSDYWRIKWSFNSVTLSVWIDRWHGFRVFEGGTGNILGGMELYAGKYQGVLYVHQGRGSYYIGVSGIEGSFTLKFTIESLY